MGAVYDALDEELIAFIQAQKMFFVATAPLSTDGHVNMSPKGYDSFRVIDNHTVAYADLGGSGIETVAHVRENQRLTIMFCAFEGAPNILRLYGKGRVMQSDHPDFATELAHFPDGNSHARNIVFLDISRVSESCGWGVPYYAFTGERDRLRTHIEKRSPEDWRANRFVSNTQSIDGLPGLIAADISAKDPD